MAKAGRRPGTFFLQWLYTSIMSSAKTQICVEHWRLYENRQRFGGGGWFVRVQRAHWGHHPSASHQRKRLQKFELWTTSVHSGVYHLLVRFPRATARRRNRRGLIVRADRQCQQLHPSTVQKVTGVSRSLLTHHSATLPGGGNLKLTPLRFIQAVKQNMDVCYKSRRN